MIARLRAFVRAHWPALRLRTILLTMVAFAAFLPGASAIFLRVYENTLVRQTEAELVAQSVALAAAAEGLWPGAAPPTDTRGRRRTPGYYQPEPATIDLGSTPVLGPRPAPRPGPPPDPEAVRVGARLDPIMERTSRTTLASLLMLDRRGVVVRGPGPVGDLGALPEVRSALAGRPMTVLRRNAAYHPRYSMEWLSRASALRIHHARPIVVDGRVEGVILSSRSPRALFRGIYQDRVKILLGIVGTLGVLLVIAALVSRGIARPIAGLSRAARDVASGSGVIPETPRTAAIEIQTLYEEFRAMAEAVERRSAYLRDFAAAVSHEFKTPLAGIQGAVELLLDHGAEMEPARRRRFLANIDADGRRLAALVSRLLDLVRADMTQPDPGSEADFIAVARRAADAAAPRLSVILDLPQGPLPVIAPAETIEVVLTVLFENSRQVGATRAWVSARADGDDLVVRIRDDGPGVARGDAERIFEPFFTTRRAEGGTGLGLSIARALLRAHRGALALRSGEEGAAFEMRLRRATTRV